MEAGGTAKLSAQNVCLYQSNPPESEIWFEIWQPLLVWHPRKKKKPKKKNPIVLINNWDPMMCLMLGSTGHVCLCLSVKRQPVCARVCVCSTAEQRTSAVVRKQAVSIQLWQLHQAGLKVAVNHGEIITSLSAARTSLHYYTHDRPLQLYLPMHTLPVPLGL